ncbi:MAG: hypothetical protein K9L61_00605 [Candidatus Omnitrophica bacterium]|nr:hypothetical protein [Candidatus Omnitrophota bacterium]
MIKYKNKKAQSILSYAALVVAVASALILMSNYVKKSIQGKYKQTADTYGGGFLYHKADTNITR